MRKIMEVVNDSSEKKVLVETVRKTVENSCNYVNGLLNRKESPEKVAQNIVALAELIKASATAGLIFPYQEN